MSKQYKLSIVIPARCEMFLKNTVEDLLAHTSDQTEIIVGLDGQWSDPQLEDNDRVKIIYVSESIGQRAITNLCVKLSTAKYVCKVDAHCSFDQDWDIKMLAAFEKSGDNVTMVSVMRNLWAFDWKCPDGHTRYQGPSGPCKEPGCGKETVRDMKWIPKSNPQSVAYCFDSTPHFQYMKEYSRRPEYKESRDKTMLTETMSLQGSCFMMTREKYWELDIGGESFGSWGSQGIQVAVSTWLSGGRVLVNHNTFYGHLFRTQGGNFGFPYPISGRQVAHAKKLAGDRLYKNNWPKQIYPSSWLLEKFYPVAGWTEEQLLKLKEAGTTFTNLRAKELGILGVVPIVPSPVANHTSSAPINGLGQKVPVVAMGLPGLSSGSSSPKQDVLSVSNQSQMSGIATESVITDMIKDENVSAFSTGDRTNEPSIHKSMSTIKTLINPDLAVAGAGKTNPIPAPSDAVNPDLFKDTVNRRGSNIIDNKHLGDVHDTSISQKVIPSIDSAEQEITDDLGIVYYTENRLNLRVAHAVQNQLRSIGLPIVSVSLKPMPHFGDNVLIKATPSYLAMFRQILAGLEASTAEYIFFAEHDVLYHPSHFDFIPPTRDKFYYNIHWWRIRLSDGFAASWEANQVSGLCADRNLLIGHYRKRVALVEKYGYSSKMGFEPGSHNDPNQHGYRERHSIPPEAYIDDIMAESWKSTEPNVDLKHGKNLSKNKWSLGDFRDKATAVNFRTGACPEWARGIIEKIGKV